MRRPALRPSAIALVGALLAPSHFLRQRYIDWGLPAERVLFEENGCALDEPASVESTEDRPRNRLGFFGQLTPFKGVHVLLEAMRLLLVAQPKAELWIHGANLELQSPEFRKEVLELISACEGSVTVVGRYEHDRLHELMSNVDWVVVPSIWWENSPLVIQEAFLHGRPVICGDIGGMAEKVKDGINGLHFVARDPRSLARTLERAVASPELWNSLRRGIPSVYRMDDHAKSLVETYGRLLEQKRRNSVAVLA